MHFIFSFVSNTNLCWFLWFNRLKLSRSIRVYEWRFTGIRPFKREIYGSSQKPFKKPKVGLVALILWFTRTIGLPRTSVGNKASHSLCRTSLSVGEGRMSEATLQRLPIPVWRLNLLTFPGYLDQWHWRQRVWWIHSSILRPVRCPARLDLSRRRRCRRSHSSYSLASHCPIGLVYFLLNSWLFRNHLVDGLAVTWDCSLSGGWPFSDPVT